MDYNRDPRYMYIILAFESNDVAELVHKRHHTVNRVNLKTKWQQNHEAMPEGAFIPRAEAAVAPRLAPAGGASDATDLRLRLSSGEAPSDGNTSDISLCSTERGSPQQCAAASPYTLLPLALDGGPAGTARATAREKRTREEPAERTSLAKASRPSPRPRPVDQESGAEEVRPQAESPQGEQRVAEGVRRGTESEAQRIKNEMEVLRWQAV